MTRQKRLLDLVIAIPGLVLMVPVFGLVAIAILVDSRGPVFFRQERIGRNGRPFLIWKFRTMNTDAQMEGGQLTAANDPRVTRVGKWLRVSKLDEFPQLINVVCGDMSLVGPRPEVARFVALYTAEHRRVLTLVPGITDPASIEYRHEEQALAAAVDLEQMYITQIMPAKILLNLAYADRETLWSDLCVIAQTIRALPLTH